MFCDKLIDEQAEVYQFARNGHNILITGQAGTGKSTVVNAIRNDCKQRGLQVDLICSSGIACQVGFRQTDPRSTDLLLTPLLNPYNINGKMKIKKAQNYQWDPIQVHQQI